MAVIVSVSDQWHPSSAKIENEFSCTSFPPIPHGVYRDRVTCIFCDRYIETFWVTVIMACDGEL